MALGIVLTDQKDNSWIAMATSSSSSSSIVFLSLALLFLVKFGDSRLMNVQDQPYRTGYHFQPPQNWMNDPNGPLVYMGMYHLFYQYNPKGAIWGNIVWAHSTSRDLVNWTPHAHAIYPSIPSDINGCWSGSATVIDGKPVILYTGINKEGKQVQNMAVPKDLSDPYLLEWVKSSYNPLMEPTPVNMINGSSFRDPTTAWVGPDGRWRLIVGNKVGRRGVALLYRSKDFVRWTKAQHSLHSVKANGMWECPDFFPVLAGEGRQIGLDTSAVGEGVKHVLKVSLDDTKYEYYTIGSYDVNKDKYVPDYGSVESDMGLRYDYGKFYASKTFFDSVNHRRVLWGWINESTSSAIDVKKGWSGIQAIPREIWLDKLGKQLIQWPIKEIEKLRTKQVTVNDLKLKDGSLFEVSGVTASQADVEVRFELPGLDSSNVETIEKGLLMNPKLVCGQKPASVKGKYGPFGLLVLASKNIQEYTAVFFRLFRVEYKYVVLMCSDQTRSSAYLDYDKPSYGVFLDVDPTKEKLSLRTLIDRSIVESFGGGGKACITSRVYPSLAINGGSHLLVFNNGTQTITVSSLSAWSMKTARIN